MNSSNKVVFLGDSGVGKSQLISTLLGQENHRPQSTVGCSLQILAHAYAAGTPDECTEFIELWDVGGNIIHRKAAPIFFDNPAGIVFVHDLTNSKSEENIFAWNDQLLSRRFCSSSNTNLYRMPSQEANSTAIGGFFDLFSNNVPVLVVGTHYDLCQNRHSVHMSLPVLRQYEHLFLDARKPLAPGSTNHILLSKFFNTIIGRSQSTNKHLMGARRKLVFLSGAE